MPYIPSCAPRGRKGGQNASLPAFSCSTDRIDKLRNKKKKKIKYIKKKIVCRDRSSLDVQQSKNRTMRLKYFFFLVFTMSQKSRLSHRDDENFFIESHDSCIAIPPKKRVSLPIGYSKKGEPPRMCLRAGERTFLYYCGKVVAVRIFFLFLS